MFILIKVNKDVYAYNEGGPNRVALKVYEKHIREAGRRAGAPSFFPDLVVHRS